MDHMRIVYVGLEDGAYLDDVVLCAKHTECQLSEDYSKAGTTSNTALISP